MIRVDTVRAIFTYVIALFTVAAGFYVIYTTRSDPTASDTIAIVAGFVGSALTFAFGAEVQSRTARQQQSSQIVSSNIAQGNGHTTPEVPE